MSGNIIENRSESKSAYRNAIDSHADSYQRIESILEKAGAAGVHRAYFLYTLCWSQAGARISEMNDLGWRIRSVHLPQSQWVKGVKTKYVLESKPLEVAPGEDWYEKLKGHPRISEKQEVAVDLPLF